MTWTILRRIVKWSTAARTPQGAIVTRRPSWIPSQHSNGPPPSSSPTHDPELDAQARASSNGYQRIQVELIELSLQQGVESQLRDPQALGRGGARQAVAYHCPLDADHELGAKREGVRLAFRESEVAKHIPASAPRSHWIIHSLRCCPLGFWLISAETPPVPACPTRR